MSIKIIICDDHPLIAQGLQSLFEHREDMEIIATADTAASLFETLKEITPDIILLDVNLPDGNGIDICKEIKKEYPDVNVLGLSNFNDRSVILRMLHNGASGYLLKSAPIKEIEKAILHIYEGGVYFGKDAQSTLSSITKKALEEIPLITKREKEVLHYLNQGYTSQQIADAMFISSLTVDSHRKNLLHKFNVSKTISLLHKAKEMGMI